jgi:hypothetical protein
MASPDDNQAPITPRRQDALHAAAIAAAGAPGDAYSNSIERFGVSRGRHLA